MSDKEKETRQENAPSGLAVVFRIVLFLIVLPALAVVAVKWLIG
ncbi:hypothetical protein HRbin30_00633 [bacterium HR30]|nr:hypothetical protein HRbin30_00633 [bacterium HR30]